MLKASSISPGGGEQIQIPVLQEHGEGKSPNQVLYGISWDHENLYFGYLLPPRIEQRPSILKIPIDSSLPIEEWSWFTERIHQIHWSPIDKALYVTNTSLDNLGLATAESVISAEWTHTDNDRLHLNSVWQDMDGVVYVCEHAHGPSRIGILQNNQISHISLGSHIHNIYRENDKLLVCSSHEASIGWYDLSGQKTIAMTRAQCCLPEARGWTRGLAVTNSQIIAGFSSESRVRDDRKTGSSFIVLFDKDLNPLDSRELQDTGNIFEIRITSEIDLAHNKIQFSRIPIDFDYLWLRPKKLVQPKEVKQIVMA